MIHFRPYLEQLLSISEELSSELKMLKNKEIDDEESSLEYCAELALGLNNMLKEHKYNLDKAKKYLDFVFTHAHDKQYP